MFYPYQENQNFDLLIRCLKNESGNCIFWIGAGISKIAGYPSWKELVLEVLLFFEKNKHTLSFEKKMEFESRLNTLAKEKKFGDLFQELKQKSSSEVLEIFKAKNFEDFPDILQWLKYVDKDLYIKGIQQLFKEAEKKQNNEIYFKLSPFLIRGISVITTNIDRGLEIALKVPESEISIVSLGNYSLNSKIFYLHGRIDKPSSWILSEGEYAERYANSSEFLNFWESFFKKYKIIIFLGYSLAEKDVQRKFYGRDTLLFWIERITKQNSKEEKIQEVIESMKMNNATVYPIPYLYENETSIFSLLDRIYNRTFGIDLNSLSMEEENEQS